MKQVKQVVMLPTEKAGNIRFIPKGEYNENIKLLNKDILWLSKTDSIYGFNRVHIYFTDNSEIKEGDWFINTSGGKNEIRKHLPVHTKEGIDLLTGKVLFKIVSSTDKEITPNSWIREDFVKKYIEMYNAGTPITEVNVEYVFVHKTMTAGDYRGYNIPKTREDGSIIISPSKTYSREEVICLIKEHRNGLVTVRDAELEYTNRFIEEHL